MLAQVLKVVAWVLSPELVQSVPGCGAAVVSGEKLFHRWFLGVGERLENHAAVGAVRWDSADSVEMHPDS